MDEPETLPPEWSGEGEGRTPAAHARKVCDYIAGMTDRFAIDEHRRLFSTDFWH
jgi:dGTPase